MDDVARAAQTIGKFLQVFTTNGGLRLRFRVKARGVRPGGAEGSEGSRAGAAAAEGAAKSAPSSLYIEFTGPDTPVLTARNGDVLNALEHLAAKILRLEPEEHDRVSFDADNFKADRDREMRAAAAAAVERVQLTGRPHAFPAMSSRERRALHMVLKESGLATASSGEGPGRFVVLYPAGMDPSVPVAAEQPARVHDSGRVRTAFRHR